MVDISLKIEGMSCQHCVMSVKKALDDLEGVSSSEVAVGTAKVVYDDLKTNRDIITNAIQNAGYSVIN